MPWLACSQSSRFFASTMQILGNWLSLGCQAWWEVPSSIEPSCQSAFFLLFSSFPFFPPLFFSLFFSFWEFYQICYMKDHFNLQVKTSLLLLWCGCLWFCSLSDFIRKTLLYNTEYQWCECAPWPSSYSHFTTNTAAVGPLGTFFYKAEEVSF